MDAHCALCHLKRNIELAETVGDEPSRKAFARDLMRLHLDAPDWASSPYLGPGTNALFEKHFGIGPDRYKQEKAESNRFVLERLPEIRAAARTAPDPVYAGLQLSILGNYLDFAAMPGQVRFEKLEKCS